MEIIFITESYLPKKNGMASVVRYLAEGLVNRGHNVSIATQRHNSEDKKNEIIDGVRIFRFDIDRSFFKKPIGEVDKFIDFVLSYSADVNIFECIGSLTSDIMFPYLKNIKSIKILHSHGNTYNTMKMFKYQGNLKYTLGNTFNYVKLWYQNHTLFPHGIKEFDACVYLSKIASDKEIIERYAKKTYILHNAADNMFFEYDVTKKKDFNLGTRYDNYILSVANYTKIKNGERMIKAYFDTQTEGYSFVMVGSAKTEYYCKLKRIVERLTQKHPDKDVVMLTGIDRSLISQIVDGATLYLTGSDYEEYSVSLIEAMSRGVPFVSTDVGNARLLPGGLTLKNPSDMAKTIDKLLNNKQQYNNLSSKGRQFSIENCREEVAVDNLITIINNIEK